MSKKKVNIGEFSRYFLLAFILVLVFLSYRIIQPYLITLISAFILVYLIRPLYLILNKKVGDSFSAIICIVLITLIVFLPIGTVIGGISTQAYDYLDKESIFSFLDSVSSLPILEKLNVDLGSISKEGVLFVISLLSSVLSYIPSLVITFIVLLLSIYYMLVGWDDLVLRLRKHIPFKDKKLISAEISEASKNIIYGTILIAFIEFVVAVAGFYIFGVNLYFLLPALIFFLAFIPGLGPIIVWVPMAIYYLYIQDWLTLIGVVITGIILSVLIDTVLRSKFLGHKAKINPVIMLVGVLGGISLFGIFGFIIGPLILVYTIKLVEEMFLEG